MENENIFISRGVKVLLELIDQSGEAERVTFTLVESKQADLRSGQLDENTPLARALLGHQAGEIIPYATGDLKEVRILSAEHGETVASMEAAERRRETVRKAETQSELINQLNFATASGSKWGDYDVDVERLMEQQKREEDNEA